MQYQVFEGMPWSDIVNDKDIIFVITQKVMDEVDIHKDGPRLRLRNRARVINGSSRNGGAYVKSSRR